MSEWKEATWQNGARVVTGRWCYNWSADVFHIQLNSKDRVTGLRRSFTVTGDTPEWGNWKRKPSDAKEADRGE